MYQHKYAGKMYEAWHRGQLKNAFAGTHSESLQATTIRVETSHKTQPCNNPPVLKYLWTSAYNPPHLLYYLSAEMI